MINQWIYRGILIFRESHMEVCSQNGWFSMEKTEHKMDLGVPRGLETIQAG